MSWSYELRSDDRLVEERRGFTTKNEAHAAASGAKRLMSAFDFPTHDESLTILTKATASISISAPSPSNPATWTVVLAGNPFWKRAARTSL